MHVIDENRIEEFAGQVLGDMAGTMTTVFCALGDRLGLFRALQDGPATSAELAARAGVQERYLREWANGLVTAGYLDHDAPSGCFSLPPEHAAVLADEASPAFMGGAHQVIPELLRVLDPLEQAFRHGGGVAIDAYGERFWLGIERLTGLSFEHLLVQEWLPAVPGLVERLREGARVADVGCGTGRAPIRLAQAFPRSRVWGFDAYAPSLARAERTAREAGVDDRVAFRPLDAVDGIPGTYDLITFFDVVHDSRDPLAILCAARAALDAGGACLILEVNCHEDLADDHGAFGTLMYGFSLTHCMTQSLAAGGAGLGTCGLPESRLRDLCLQAGFSSLERIAEEPMDVLYLARP